MDKQKRFRDTSLRLQSYDYSKPGFYFITVCTYQREHHFGTVNYGEMILNESGIIANEFWKNMEHRFPQCRTHTFVVMPNHIHGIIEILPISKPVGSIHESSPPAKNKSYSKPAGSIHELNLLRVNEQSDVESNRKRRRKMIIPMVVGWYKMNVSKQINLIRNSPGVHIWQRNYYEHIIRDQTSFEIISEYIRYNSQKWNRDRFMVN